ncbi:hypothetical protein EVG20_g6127 [Dentipellis fragilis]|uniref:Uncharacterized protein n=1 Tax=Dentipellis fragilis TaxID=205917 RepID=A0A4Y9YMV8_9AGAM|nr:hypothetical protein EVG20_g6127 [Dentipellis fragilis]
MPQDDPRDASLESRFTPPQSWTQESVDSLSTSGVFLSGLIMVTRNRYLAWPSFLLGINAWINQHPLRTKEGGSPPIGNVLLAFFALVASYLPFLIRPQNPSGAQSELPIHP